MSTGGISTIEKRIVYGGYISGILVWAGLVAVLYSVEMVGDYPTVVIAVIGAPFALAVNTLLWHLSAATADFEVEIERSGKMATYSSYVISAVVGTLLAAAAIPGSTDIGSPPPEFAIFQSLALAFALVGVLTPYWIPNGNSSWLTVLRHIKTIFLVYSIFLFLTGVLIMVYWIQGGV